MTSLPSRTSILVAAARAMGARYPDPDKRNPDMLAEKLMGPAEIELIKEHPMGVAVADPTGSIPPYAEQGMDVMMLVRTKYVDSKVVRAMEEGAAQLVILGAGFDTRAYRFADLLREVKVFEVDSAATQRYKRARAEATIGPPPANVTYVTVDFNHDVLEQVLHNAGYDPSQKTIFTWEGVSMYVAEPGTRTTLKTVSQARPGSRLVMDYTTQSALKFMQANPEFGPNRYLNAWGEPWIFGLPDGQEKEFFASVGLELREVLPVYGQESVRQYLTLPDGRVLGAPSQETMSQRLLRTATSAASLMGKNGSSFYTLAELVVPER